MNTFWVGVWITVSPWLVAGLIAFVSVLVLKFLSIKKVNLKYVEISLDLVKQTLKNKLGDKADAVINAWIEGLKWVEDGEFTKDEMLTEFMKVIDAITGKTVVLTSEEEAIVKQVAGTTIDMLMANKEVVKSATIKIMSV